MSLSLRAGAMLAAGSLAVHELRYLAGGDGSAAGHGYLAWLAPLIALTLAAVFGGWLARIGRDRSTSRASLTWFGASSALLVTYVVQETVEGLSSPAHPGLLAHGGWIAAPIAVAVGGLVALMLRGARAADRAAAVAARPWSAPTATAVAAAAPPLPVAAPLAPRPRVLARRLAGRAPPYPS